VRIAERRPRILPPDLAKIIDYAPFPDLRPGVASFDSPVDLDLEQQPAGGSHEQGRGGDGDD